MAQWIGQTENGVTVELTTINSAIQIVLRDAIGGVTMFSLTELTEAQKVVNDHLSAAYLRDTLKHGAPKITAERFGALVEGQPYVTREIVSDTPCASCGGVMFAGHTALCNHNSTAPYCTEKCFRAENF